LFFEKTPSAIIKEKDCSKREDPVGPKPSKDKRAASMNQLSIGPVNKTVEGKPQGKPPNGKYALIKSKIATTDNNT
jgi:hypothetical protein